MARDGYLAQVDLLVKSMPIVAAEEQFALKGGTAINLFYRDLPRLSVDIDLVYLPLDVRKEALENIDVAFDRMVKRANEALADTQAQRIQGGGDGDTRLLVRSGDAQVKVEVSPVTRGIVGVAKAMRVSAAVEETFGFAEMQVVPFEDLYGGKLVAALDRQHPRDLYDVHLLYEHEGLTDELFNTFLIYASCSSRPMHELLNPQLHSLNEIFAKEFDGMTLEPVTLDSLQATRSRLVEDIQKRLKGNAAEFLMSMQDCRPDFELIGYPHAAELPAIKWKLINLDKLREQNIEKYNEQRSNLVSLMR